MFKTRKKWTGEQRAAVLAAFETIQSLGLPVEAALQRYQDCIADQDAPIPDVDRNYSVPTECPKTADHLGEGRKSILSAHQLWMGLSYELSPGQRKWFREFAGMTPSQTVTVGWVEVWEGTNHPRSFKIVSDQHVDPRNRSHVLVEFVVSEAGEFFRKSTAFDQELREEKKTGEAAVKIVKEVKQGKVKKPVDYDEFLQMLEEEVGE